MKKIFSLFAAVLFAGSMFAGKYVKVTEAPADWAGQYLIVYEGDATHSSVAFDGSLTALDAVNNGIAVTISNGEIESSEALTAAEFTIAAVTGGYSVQAASGKFIGATSYSNSLATSDAAIVNNLDELVPAVTLTGGTVTMKYNYANNQMRFRYYKSGQQTVYLYKFEGEKPQVEEFYLVGSFCEWERSAEYKLAANKEAEGEYMIRLDIPANSKMKVQGVLGEVVNWYPDGVDNDFVINDEGDYTIYFRPAGDGDQAAGWHYGYIFAVYHEPIVVTNCATAREAALSVADGEYYKEDEKEVFTIRGYVTKIETEYSDKFHNISFWLADAADGGEVIEAFRAACASAEAAPEVGDYVELTGKIKNYKGTPEFDAGCEFTILETPTAVDNTNAEVKAEKFFRNGQLIIRKNGVEYNATGAIVK